MEWVRKYKKMDFSNVIFTNKCHTTPDGPDEWAKCWISIQHCPLVRVRHQQVRCGVIFWSAIIDDGSRRTFQNTNGVRIDSLGYYAFLNKHFLLGGTKQPLCLWNMPLLTPDNVLSDTPRYIKHWLIVWLSWCLAQKTWTLSQTCGRSSNRKYMLLGDIIVHG